MEINIKNKTLKFHATPKVACSTGKMELLNMIESDPKVIDHIFKEKLLHKNWPTHLFTPSTTDFKICFIRDPIERFESAYRDIVLKRKVIQDFDVNNFIKNFNKYLTNESVKHHFQPQTIYIGSDPEYYTQIFNIENLQPFYNFLYTEFEYKAKGKVWNATQPQKLNINIENLEILKKYYNSDIEFISKVKQK